MENIILIVDPFSTGKLYAQRFSQLGYQCYSVLSSRNVPELFMKNYDRKFFQNNDLLSIEETKKLFPKDKIKAVVIGSETGVISGEILADYFNVKGNSIENTHFRRNKFIMQEQLAQRGLDHIHSQIITRQNQDINDFPHYSSYILKPINSAGTENVIFCQNKKDLEKNINAIQWGEINATGEENNAFLVQEFIEGTEFVVDMVVDKNGVHTASLCRYQKGRYNNSHFVYKHMEMLDMQDKQFQQIIDYAHQCANVLGFKFGAVHMEIMHNNERTVMIEAGARLHGGIAPLVFQNCYQPDLLSLSINAYLDEIDMEMTKQTQFARVVFMINQKSNAVLDVNGFHQEVKKLPSFKDCVVALTNPLPLTTDLLTCPCLVSLVSNNQESIERDEQKLRTIFEQYLTH